MIDCEMSALHLCSTRSARLRKIEIVQSKHLKLNRLQVVMKQTICLAPTRCMRLEGSVHFELIIVSYVNPSKRHGTYKSTMSFRITSREIDIHLLIHKYPTDYPLKISIRILTPDRQIFSSTLIPARFKGFVDDATQIRAQNLIGPCDIEFIVEANVGLGQRVRWQRLRIKAVGEDHPNGLRVSWMEFEMMDDPGVTALRCYLLQLSDGWPRRLIAEGRRAWSEW